MERSRAFIILARYPARQRERFRFPFRPRIVTPQSFEAPLWRAPGSGAENYETRMPLTACLFYSEFEKRERKRSGSISRAGLEDSPGRRCERIWYARDPT